MTSTVRYWAEAIHDTLRWRHPPHPHTICPTCAAHINLSDLDRHNQWHRTAIIVAAPTRPTPWDISHPTTSRNDDRNVVSFSTRTIRHPSNRQSDP